MTTEAQVHADIEALRQRFTDTQELYREVCTVLFFRYGITPTANKLYQYVRKGSMSAPAEALTGFWENLREKSRVRIEHPELPDTLKSAAGDLVATLWTQAQAAAQEGLVAFRSEAQSTVLEARTAQTSAENERAAALLERDRALKAIEVATDSALALERELAAARAIKFAMGNQMEAAERRHAAMETALADARRDFAVELEKLRQALQRSEQRCEATEKRALLEIDRERVATAKAQKDLVQVRQYHQEIDERRGAEMAQLRVELGSARQQLGVSEGMLQEARMRCQQQADELQTLRSIVTEGEARKSLLVHDLTTSKETNTKLETELQQLRLAALPENAATKPRKRTRKTAV